MTTPVVIIFMVSIGIVFYIYLLKTIRDSAFDAAQTVIQHTETKILSLYERAENNMRLFSGSSILTHYFLTSDEEERVSLLQPTLIRLFSSYLKANPDYYEMRVLMPDGYEDTRVILQDLNNYTDQEKSSSYFSDLKQHKDDIFTTIYTNPDNAKPAFLIGKKFFLRDTNRDPITSPASLRGYLTVTVDILPLAQHLHTPQERFGTNCLIMDKTGKILFSSLATEQRRFIEPDLFNLIKQNNNFSKPITYYNQKSNDYIFSKIVHNDFILLAIIPKKNLYADTNSLGVITIIITLVFIIIFSGLLIFIGEKLIVSPIMGLRNAAVEMGKGNLDIEPQKHPNDEIGELARSLHSMATSLQKSQAQIRHLAYHDFLTGLPNRVMFDEFLKRAVVGAQRHNEMLAVLFIDLDNFKRINDNLGHKTGDLLLKKVALQIESAVRHTQLISRSTLNRETDQVARIGGDEFIIVLPYIEHLNDAAQVSRRLLEALSLPFLLDAHEVYITVSIGISIFPMDSDIPEKLVRNADIAMYHAKENGKNNYRYYSPSMNTEAHERLTVEGELRRALARNEFIIKYQPQVDSFTGKIVGLEALIRWEHPTKGLILPNDFIPIAEETGLIIPIGEWVFHSTALQIKEWLNKKLPMIPISVNLSSIQFLNCEIDKVILEIIEKTGIPASTLKVELTESVLIKAKKNVLRSLNSIQNRGIHICLDDFGTGYSSLTYLKEFPINELKIDRSFITNLVTEKKDAEIISAMIALAKCLGLTVVAEGVEHAEQLDFLKSKQCDTIQGFYFYRPLFASEVEELLSA